ncbi:MAG TPA: NUDIX hydrolase [Bacillales bacterium]|nr:NUDIX hydrolase [Bacillales bacterium]
MGYILDLRKFVGSRPLIVAGACVIVLNKDNQILLQKRTDSQDWGTIGGSLELGESLEEAAGRELFEEANLTAERFKFITLLSGQDMYYKYPHGDEVYNVMAVYEAEEISGTPTVNDDEGLGLQYFSLDEPIPGLNPFSELVLKKAGYLKE